MRKYYQTKEYADDNAGTLAAAALLLAGFTLIIAIAV
jgi:hypothetical protein